MSLIRFKSVCKSGLFGLVLLPLTASASHSLGEESRAFNQKQARDAIFQVFQSGAIPLLVQGMSMKIPDWTWSEKRIEGGESSTKFHYAIQHEGGGFLGWAMHYAGEFNLKGDLTSIPIDNCPAPYDSRGYQLDANLAASDTSVKMVAKSFSVQVCFGGVLGSNQKKRFQVRTQVSMESGSIFENKPSEYFLEDSHGAVVKITQSFVQAWADTIETRIKDVQKSMIE